MNVALCCGGSSLHQHLPFSRSGIDVVVAVNDAGHFVPWDHWAAADTELHQFRQKFTDWQSIDWDHRYLTSRTVLFPTAPRFTTPMVLEEILRLYDPDELHAYGIDMSGDRLDGVTAKQSRWAEEEEHLRRIDLDRVTWHGLWHP